MFAGSTVYKKISRVITRDVVSVADLAYTKKYMIPRRWSLAMKYSSVDEKNRFESLRILLSRLSGYVGRRQYKMQNDLDHLLDGLIACKIDWHDFKHMSSSSAVQLLCAIGAQPAERLIVMTALHAKLCGVLTEAMDQRDRNPQTICMRRGLKKYGWRCGHDGHDDDVYFENKNPASKHIVLSRRAQVQRFVEQDVAVELRKQPDFSIEGNIQQEPNPRVWHAPKDARFNVMVMGFEFLLHSSDPRAKHQIADASQEWAIHGKAIASVLHEMLEMYGVETDPQPLAIEAGDINPEPPFSWPSKQPVGAEESPCEYRMITTEGKVIPWFRSAPPKKFVDGMPEYLPFAPTVIVRSQLEPFDPRSEQAEQLLRAPTIRISVLCHPKACFTWPLEFEQRAVSYVLEVARNVPWALPFNFHMRVDPARLLRVDPNFAAERQDLFDSNCEVFNLKAKSHMADKMQGHGSDETVTFFDVASEEPIPASDDEGP